MIKTPPCRVVGLVGEEEGLVHVQQPVRRVIENKHSTEIEHGLPSE